MTERVVPTLRHYDWGLPFYESIISHFTTHPEVDRVAEAWWPTDAFLLKLISVGKPLSIQVHPNKEMAWRLHLEYRHQYDPNEKPEMALALTPFSALCGFLHLDAILPQIKIHPRLVELFSNCGKDNGVVQEKFIQMLSWNDEEEEKCLFLGEIKHTLVNKERRSSSEDLILLLLEKFPNDVAALSPFFLQHVQIGHGYALVIPPGCPHCYLEGQAVECMANSDNVVRAGLTSKPCDLDLFKELLYASSQPVVLPPQISYSHPCFSKYFELMYASDDVVVRNLNRNAIVLIMNGIGMLNGNPTMEGEAWLCREEYIVAEGGLTIVVVLARK